MARGMVLRNISNENDFKKDFITRKAFNQVNNQSSRISRIEGRTRKKER